MDEISYKLLLSTDSSRELYVQILRDLLEEARPSGTNAHAHLGFFGGFDATACERLSTSASFVGVADGLKGEPTASADFLAPVGDGWRCRFSCWLSYDRLFIARDSLSTKKITESFAVN